MASFSFPLASPHRPWAAPRDDGAHARDHDAVDTLLAALGENLRLSGDLLRAKEMFRRAALRAREQGSASRLARAALGFAGGPRVFEQDPPDPQAVALLEEALCAVPAGPSRLRECLTVRLALALAGTATAHARRRALCDEALASARERRDAAAEVAALYARHEAAGGPDDLRARLDATAEMLRLAAGPAGGETALHAHRLRFRDLLELGDRRAADVHLDACVRLGGELRRPAATWHAGATLAEAMLLDGRLAASEHEIDAARTAGRRARQAEADQHALRQLVGVRREQARLAEIEPTLHRLVERGPSPAASRSVHALVLAELGRTSEAHARLAPLTAGELACVPRDLDWLAALSCVGDVCAELGDAPRAATVYCRLEPYRGRVAARGPGVGCLGAVDRVLGRLAALLDGWDLAAQHFAAALHTEEALGAPLLAARTRLHRAACLVARGRRGDVPAVENDLAHAEAAYRAHGAVPGRFTLLHELARSLERRPASRRRTHEPRGSATRGAMRLVAGTFSRPSDRSS